MENYDDIREFLNRDDRFCIYNSIRLTKVEEDYAEGEMILSENNLNGLNVAQGGSTYTLADFTFAGAANANPDRIVYIGSASHIFYLRPGTGEKLTAKAKIINRSRRTCLADVEVYDDRQKLVAKVMCSGAVFHPKPDKDA